jgi:hypothetical protein
MSPRPYPRQLTERRISEVQLLYGLARWRLDQHVHLRRHGLREPTRCNSNSHGLLNHIANLRQRRKCHSEDDRRRNHYIFLRLRRRGTTDADNPLPMSTFITA